MSQYQSHSQRTQGSAGNQSAQSRVPSTNLPVTSSIISSNINTYNFTYLSGNYETQAIQEAILQWSNVGDGRGDIVIHG